MNITRITELDENNFLMIIDLIKQLNGELKLPDRAYIESILQSDSSVLLAAVDDDEKICGMLTLALCRIPSGRCAHIEDVVVDQSCRGQGIGEQLVRSALQTARELGVKQVDLTSNPAREAANRLYQRIGFSRRDTNLYRFPIPEPSEES